MVAMNPRVARLNKDDIGKLQALEKELGKVVVAFDPPPAYAELSAEGLRKVQQLEKELGVVLIAMKA